MSIAPPGVMSIRVSIVALSFAVSSALAACGSEQNQPQGSDHAPPPAANMSGARQLGMRNCPSHVPGAKTQAANAPTGVVLLITADQPIVRDQIVQLAKFHSGPHDPSAPPHSGKRGGPGTIGYCPIVHGYTTVTFDQVPNGVRINVSAPPDRVKQLQQTTAERMRALVLPTS